MGFLRDCFEIRKLSKEINRNAGLDATSMKTISACWTKAKAISAQAAKYVMEYPVACSVKASSDYEKAYAISKQIEIDCARFIILASGLNPIIDRKSGDTIEAHLNSMVKSFESFGLPCTIEPATEEFINAGKEYMNKYYSTELYHTFVDNDEFETDSLDRSYEASDVVNAYTDVGDNPKYTDLNGNTITSSQVNYVGPKNDYNKMLTMIKRGFGEHRMSTVASFKMPSEQHFEYLYTQTTGLQHISPEDLAKGGMNIDVARQEYDDTYNEYERIMSQTKITEASATASNNSDILKKLQGNGPTIVTITLYLTDGAGGQRAIQLPLAIKSTLQFIESVDLTTLFKGTQNKASFLQKFIKLTTGQMSFFRDWLFAIDEADTDIERTRALGTVPIFRRLIDAKNRHRIKSIIETRPILSKFIAGKSQKDLPICTIVCTIAEIEDAMKTPWNILVRNRKRIDEIIDTYMLLGLGVLDEIGDRIYFFYAGENEPTVVDIKKIGNSSGNDTNKHLAEAIVNTTRMMSRR